MRREIHAELPVGRLFPDLEVNHPANPVNVVVTEYIRCGVDGTIADLAIDIVELHSGI